MKNKTATVRTLRRKETCAEDAAWHLLRDRRCGGLKFRRQVPIENCVVDFFSFEERLAVELDGSIHAQPSQLKRDRERDAMLKRLGIRVIRVPNGLVAEDPDGFVRKVRTAALERLIERSDRK